jgi:hypothetical protein
MRRRDFVNRRISHRMAACVRAQQVEGVRQIGVLMGYSDGERQGSVAESVDGLVHVIQIRPAG